MPVALSKAPKGEKTSQTAQSRGGESVGAYAHASAARVPAYSLGQDATPSFSLLGGGGAVQAKSDAAAEPPPEQKPEETAPATPDAVQKEDEEEPSTTQESEPAEDSEEVQAKAENAQAEPEEMRDVQADSDAGGGEGVGARGDSGASHHAASDGGGAGAGGSGDGGAEHSGGGGARRSGDGSPVHETAERGLRGASRPLPNLGRIQESFGRHDVSGVRVEVGGAAERASKDLGARAYTSDNRIAFKHEPDLRLAAHEAAHVVQQRRGVQLKGGVGREGDPYERQADRAADAVVAGQSAEPVLSSSPAGGDAKGGVQKKCGGGGSCACESCAGKEQEAPVQAAPVQLEVDCTVTEEAGGSREQAASAQTAPNLGNCTETNGPAEEPPEGTEEPSREETPADVEANEGAPVDDRQSNAPPPDENAPEGEEGIAEEGSEAAEQPRDPCAVREAAGLGGGGGGASTSAGGGPAVATMSSAAATMSTPAAATSAGPGPTSSSSSEGATPAEGAQESAAPAEGGENGFLDEAISSAAAAPSPEGLGEAASPVVAAERDQLSMATDEALAALDGTSSMASSVVSGEVQFLPPAGEQAAPAHRRASAMASRILSEGGDQLNAFIERGRSAALALRDDTAEKRAALDAEIQRHRGGIQELSAQLRGEAQAQADLASQQVEARHAAMLATIEARALDAETRVGTSYTDQSGLLEEARAAQLTRLDEVYQTGYDELIGVGTTKGRQADERAATHERAYRNADNASPEIQQRVRNRRKDGFWDGYLSYNRYMARADSARETGKQFREGFEKEAKKQADNMMCSGKPRDIEMTGLIAGEGLRFLGCARDNGVDSIEEQRVSAVEMAEQSRRAALDTIRRSLQATLAQLDAREAGQLSLLNDYGVRQSLAIERDAERAAGALLQGVNEGAQKIVGYLSSFRSQVESSEAPPPAALGQMAAERSRLRGVIARAQAAADAAQSQAQSGLDGGQSQALGALQQVYDRGVEELRQLGDGFRQGVGDVVAGALSGYDQTQAAFEERVSGLLENAVQTLEGVVAGTTGMFGQINAGTVRVFAESKRQMETGFQSSLDNDLDNKVCAEAEKAAAEVQPWWKDVLKVLLIIVVIVVVAFVLGPAIIGAVGAAAGALAGSLGAGAALAGAIGAWAGPIIGGAIVGAIAGGAIQVGSNAIYNKPLTEGLQNAVIAGAIGGALGGLGGQLGQVLVGRFATTAFSRIAITYGTDAVFNVVGSIAGDLATGNPITWQSIATGVAIGGAVSIATSGIGRFARVRATGATGGAAGEAAEGVVGRLARGRLGAVAEGLTNLQQGAMGLGERVGARLGSVGPRAPTVSATRTALADARARIEAGEVFPSRPPGPEGPGGRPAAPTEPAPTQPGEAPGRAPTEVEPPAGRAPTEEAPAGRAPTEEPAAGRPSTEEAPAGRAPDEAEPPTRPTTEGEAPARPGAEGEPAPRPGTEGEVKTENLERGINAEQELPGGHSRRVRSDLEVEGCSNCDLLKRRYQQLFDDGHVELDPAQFRRILGEFDEVRSRYISQHGENILTPPGRRASPARREAYAAYLREVQGIEARLMRHVNPQRLLAVGESTYEYSRALRQQLDQEGAVRDATDITASGLQSASEAASLIRARITDPPFNTPPQSGRGYTVEHGVNATELHTRFGPDSFDRIVFNNPEAEVPNPATPGKTMDITEDVINGLLRSAPSVLRPGGQVNIGITGSPVAKGRGLLFDYAARGTVEIGGRRYSVTRVAVEEFPHAARYPSRRTEGGRLRSSMGPKMYFIFRLHPASTPTPTVTNPPAGGAGGNP